MYTIQELMALVNVNPNFFVVAAFITYGFGFWQYLTSMYMQIRNKECPFYFWQHCWYFGHDITFSLLFNMWWKEIGFWLFKVLNIGCMIFVLIEFVSLYYAVKYEKNWNWGKYFNGRKVPMNKAWMLGIAGYIMGAMLFAVIRKLIGDPCCFFLMTSTNCTLALMCRFNTKERRYRRRGTRMLAIATFFGTIFNFLPKGYGFFASIIPGLHQPAWYILGFFCILTCIEFLYTAFTLPTKEEFLAQGGEIFYVEDWQEDEIEAAKA